MGFLAKLLLLECSALQCGRANGGVVVEITGGFATYFCHWWIAGALLLRFWGIFAFVGQLTVYLKTGNLGRWREKGTARTL